jgi:hypothetical protein
LTLLVVAAASPGLADRECSVIRQLTELEDRAGLARLQRVAFSLDGSAVSVRRLDDGISLREVLTGWEIRRLRKE